MTLYFHEANQTVYRRVRSGGHGGGASSVFDEPVSEAEAAAFLAARNAAANAPSPEDADEERRTELEALKASHAAKDAEIADLRARLAAHEERTQAPLFGGTAPSPGPGLQHSDAG
jgi:hypothetical protein